MVDNISIGRMISSGIWIFSLSGVTFITNFIVNLYTAKILGPETFGTYVYYSIIQSIIAILTSIPINTVYIQKKDYEVLFDSCWYACAFACLINFILGMVVFTIIYDTNYKLLFIALNINQIFVIYSGLYLAILEKKIDYKKISLINIGVTLISSIVCIIMLYKGFDIISLLLKEILYGILLLIAAIFLSKKLGPSVFDYKQILQVLKSVINLTLMRGAETAYFRIPIYIYGLQFGEKNLGIFNQGIYLSSLLNAVLSPIIQGPIFSFLTNINDKAKEILICNWTAALLLMISFVYYLLIFFCGNDLISYVYGEKWSGLNHIVTNMILYSCFLPIFNLTKVILVKQNKQYFVTIAYLLNTLLLTISLISSYKFILLLNFQEFLSLSISLTSIFLLILSRIYVKNIIIIMYSILLLTVFIVSR